MHSILSTLLGPLRHGGKPAGVPATPIHRSPPTLHVTGQVLNQLCLSVADLQAMPGHDWVARTSKAHMGHAQKTQTTGYRGVLLREIVLQAALKCDDPKGWKRAYVVAHANDGHSALFSWNELLNTEVGDGVLVVYAQHNEPPTADTEQLFLVSRRDRHSGARHVKRLNSIELRTNSD
ncbi:hypothetical protein [Pseudomonas sp.]|uniref:hypothetical protein n=1 Tax=Pseudomonas sp. TaxID=306 RepID=UPI003C749ECC